VLAQELLDGEVEVLVRKCIAMALEGDPGALRLCLERILPPRRETTVQLDLPPIADGGAPGVIAAIIKAVGDGEVTPGEGQKLAGTVVHHLRATEVAELEQRIASLEAGAPLQARIMGMSDDQLVAQARRILARHDATTEEVQDE